MNDYARRNVSRSSSSNSRKSRRGRKVGGAADNPNSFAVPTSCTNSDLNYQFTESSEFRGMAGDSNLLTGATVPTNWYQSFMNWFNGKNTILAPTYRDVLNQPSLQLNCAGNSCAPVQMNAVDPVNSTGSVGSIVTLNGKPVDGNQATFQVYATVDNSYVPPARTLPQDQRA